MCACVCVCVPPEEGQKIREVGRGYFALFCLNVSLSSTVFELNLNCPQPPKLPTLGFDIGQRLVVPPPPPSLVMNMFECG